MTATRSDRRRFWLGGKRRPEQDEFFVEALDPAIWELGDAERWDTCWYTGMPDPAVFRSAAPERTINHIPGNNCLTVKSLLHATLMQTRDRLVAQEGPDHERVARLAFAPRVYTMPDDYAALQQAAHEAPAKRWILKPRNAARGKDIRVVTDVATVPVGDRWIVQEYIDNPHTMNGHKYVLRLYVLIACVEPLRVYLYEQGFAKLASAPYTLEDLDNPYAHLTNPDINALNTDAAAPVVFVDFDRYRSWLRGQGHDDGVLFSRIRDIVALTVISAREHMRQRTRDSGADPRGCYELLGLDCLVDAKLRPWILECNLSPSMEVCAAPEDGGLAEAQIKRRMVADMVALLGFNTPPSGPSLRDPAERMVAEAEEEQARAGGFLRVFPAADVKDYLPFLPLPRLADIVLADAVASSAVPRPRLRRWQAAEIIVGDRLVLYGARNGQSYRTNATAAMTWLHATEGLDPDAIADALHAASVDAGDQTDAWRVREDVWGSLADWVQRGLLTQEGKAPLGKPAGSTRSPDTTASPGLFGQHWEQQLDLEVGASLVRIRSAEAPVIQRLRDLLSPMATQARSPASRRQDIHIVRAAAGYAAIVNATLEGRTFRLAEVAPWLVTHLLQHAAGEDQLALDACLVPLGRANRAAMICCVADITDSLALALAARCGHGFGGGLLFAPGGTKSATVVGLPLRSSVAEFRLLKSRSRSSRSHLHQTAALGDIHLLPAVHAGKAYEVSTVILPRRATAEAHSVTPVAVDDLLACLLPRCYAAAGTRPAADAVMKLAGWLAECDTYAVDPSDTVAAVDELSRAGRVRAPQTNESA